MTSTLTAATLTVKITETISLNGKDQGSTNTLTISSINEVSKRIVTVTTTEATVATFSAAIAAGNYIAANVRYIRFTNKDDTNFITLTFRNQDNDEIALKLDYGQSFVLTGDNSNGMTAIFNATEDADAASSANFGSLTNIQADADTASCDLEMFIASV
mgnify:CR=1 FL=1|jgi:opacity protein-like surface antigen|tara:strand:+ start:2049 stop:2525 length:477 start_codon:yes stop_codon:yes gene_type:complete